MKTIITKIARIILGVILLVFGLNKFINFMPMPEIPQEAAKFMMALMDSGYVMKAVAVTEVIVGTLLILNRYVALSLILFAPIAVNIVLFHLALAPVSMLGVPGYLVGALSLYLLFSYRSDYTCFLKAS